MYTFSKQHVNVKLFCNATPPTLYNPHAFNCNPVHNIINKYKIHDRKLPKNMKISLKGSPWNNILIYSSLICGWIVWAKSLGFFIFLGPQEISSRSKWMQNHKSLNQLCTAFWRRARLKLHKCGYLNAEEPVRVCMTHSMLISTEDYSRTNVLIKPFLMKIKIR